MINLIVISVLIMPWLILPFNNLPEPTRLIKAAFFDITMMGIICMTLINGLKFEYKNKYLGWLSAWIFFTIVFNWYYPMVRGIGYNFGAIESNIHFILSIVATILVCSTIERIDFVRIAKALCISSTLVSIFCIFQAVGLDPMKHIATYIANEPRHVVACLDHPDIVGNYLCMTLPLFIYLNRKRYLFCLGICLITLLLTKSSLSIAAGFISLSIYMLFRYSRNKAIVLSIICSFILFLLAIFYIPSFNKFSNGFTGRTEAWQEIFKRTDNPLFGQGLGVVKSLGIKTGKFQENFWMYAHNDYLELYCALGAFGLFLLMLVIIHAMRKFNYKEDNQVGYAYYGGFIAFLIVMFGSFPLEMPPLALSGLIMFWAVSKT